MSSTQRRFQSDADLEDVEGSSPREAMLARPRTARARSASRGAGAAGGASRWFGAPVVYGALAMLALLVLAQVYEFSGVEGHPPLRTPFYNKSMVEFSTKFGAFTIELYPEHAPRTVDMFRRLVDVGFYTSEAGFYHNEPKWLLQGGGYLYDKPSPFGQLPVEYSLPSTERMVVMARGKKSDSGSTEFAIMLHDNTRSNQPTEDDPGYTAFGRVISGWHSVEHTSKKMSIGFMSKENRERQVAFESVKFVDRITHDWPEVQKRLEHFRYVLETPHTVIIISELDCPEKKEIEATFRKLRTSVRTAEIGHSVHHPYEYEAVEALTGINRESLPAVFIENKYVGGLKEVQKLQRMGQLRPLLEKTGTLAEDTVWTAINQHPLVLFSKSFCPYCKKTKETLAALGANPVVFELDLREDGTAIQNFLFRLTHQATVPNVFIKGKSIGGNDDTQNLYKSGELEERLRRAGAIA